LLGQNPIHQENHSKKVSLLFLQEIGYKKANVTSVELLDSQLKRWSYATKQKRSINILKIEID